MRKIADKGAGPGARGLQYGALPYRTGQDGRLEVLLITSRGMRRWLIPKGWPMKGKKPHEAAATEAFEEAGAVGNPGKRRIGTYDYRKRFKGSLVRFQVEVYPLSVSRLKAKWPERAERVRQWFDAEAAAGVVDEPGLEALLTAIRVRGDLNAGLGA